MGIIQEPWRIASKQRSSTTREYLGAVTKIDDLRGGKGEFESAEDFYKFWRKYPFRIGRVVQQQLDKLLREQYGASLGSGVESSAANVRHGGTLISRLAMKTFGIVISEARKAMGLSQKELAAQIKKEDGTQISPQYLNDIERDRRNAPSEHLILEFSRVLSLNKDYLFALARAWPKDILDRMSNSSSEEVQKAFSAFRKTLAGRS